VPAHGQALPSHRVWPPTSSVAVIHLSVVVGEGQRKSMSGHNLIADATRASGDVMASQMLDMAEASCELERSKIEVQLKLFMEQMAY
jgi:hypothetical protein